MMKFFPPVCRVRNVSNKSVSLLGLTSINPGETIDLYKDLDRRTELYDFQITKALEKPHGNLYIESELKRTIEIVELRLTGWNYALVKPENMEADNDPFPGAVLASIGDDRFEWVATGAALLTEAPLQRDGATLSIARGTADTSGYLHSEDFTRFEAGLKNTQRIWQYQDFAPPVGTSLSLTAFENGSGLGFDAEFLIDDTAVATLISNPNRPPVSTLDFPGSLLPGNRVVVDSHIGSTVIFNQSADESLGIRVYFLISLPAAIPLPTDYKEAPKFLSSDLSYQDDMYVNQNADESIFGQKTFVNNVVLNAGLRLSAGAVDGYYLKSDGDGNVSWASVEIPDDLSLLPLDGSRSMTGGLNLDGNDLLNPGMIDIRDGGLILPHSLDPATLIETPIAGQIVYDTDDGYIAYYDGEVWSKVGEGDDVSSGGVYTGVQDFTNADLLLPNGEAFPSPEHEGTIFILKDGADYKLYVSDGESWVLISADATSQEQYFEANDNLVFPLDGYQLFADTFLFSLDTDVNISSDGTDLIFADKNGGATLTTLKSMRNIWINADGYGDGYLIFNDPIHWDAQFSFVSGIRAITNSTDWHLWICEDAGFDKTKSTTRQVVKNGLKDMVINVGMEVNSSDNNLYLIYEDASGSGEPLSLYITGEARRK